MKTLLILISLLCVPNFLFSQKVQVKKLANYQKNIAGGKLVSAWLGQRTALVIDGEKNPEKRDHKIMAELVHTFDKMFKAYEEITGVKPNNYGHFKNLATIEVSDKVGGGLAHHNQLGIAVGTGFFENLYKRWKKGEKTLDQIYFYETARNFWPPEFNRKIDYHTTTGVNDYGWWTVGFNNAMSIFLPAEIPQIKDMYYFGSNGKQFSDGMEKNIIKYIEGNYSWKEGFCINLVPWAERTSLNDLMTALLIQLHRDYGGNKFIKRLYHEIPKLKDLKGRDDYQGARDNFYIASSLAAKKDLSDYYKKLRWDISENAKKEVIKKLQ